jgi:tRNA1Val (adenine37-N6)-methyltransferase
MMAQRTPENTVVEAIEIEQQAFEEALFNVAQSPWQNRIHLTHQSLQDFSSEPFDLIVCNPPFFYNSMKPPDDKRMLARHADSLPMNMLAVHSKRLLGTTGIVSIIIPFVDQVKIKSFFREHDLHCTHVTQIRTKKNKLPERSLLSFTTALDQETLDELILLEDNGNRTKEYSALTKDFYLKL